MVLVNLLYPKSPTFSAYLWRRYCKLKVFLCHSSDDKPKVLEIYHRLLNDGFDAWLDEDKILPGQDWDLEIEKAVNSSDIVLVILSKKLIMKTGYVQKEICMALDLADKQPEGAIFLIPAKIEECQIPERLTYWQWVNLFDGNGYSKLKKSLATRAQFLASEIIK